MKQPSLSIVLCRQIRSLGVFRVRRDQGEGAGQLYPALRGLESVCR